jgi:hypothetical protein
MGTVSNRQSSVYGILCRERSITGGSQQVKEFFN